VVLFTIAAVVAIVLVNSRTQAAALAPAMAPATEVHLAPVDCADCGEVIAVRAAEAADGDAPAQVQGAVLLDVRMTDGSVRTVKQFAPGFDVGDRVQVNGNALVARG
jgi:hypothetical protein